MAFRIASKLNPKKRYLQVALNSTLEDAYKIINELPVSDRIIVEAGTPLIKRYGEEGIRKIRQWYGRHIMLNNAIAPLKPDKSMMGYFLSQIAANMEANADDSEENILTDLVYGLPQKPAAAPALAPQNKDAIPYIVADLKTMDRAEAEVQMAARAGASAAVALGTAPVETLDSFIDECEKTGLDAMIDMMNVDFPINILRALKKIPPVVILHRGVDEEKFNREKMIPLHEIRRIKGNYNIMISIAGGDTLREVQSSVFNDADIVVVWKSVFKKDLQTPDMIKGFLKEIK